MKLTKCFFVFCLLSFSLSFGLVAASSCGPQVTSLVHYSENAFYNEVHSCFGNESYLSQHHNIASLDNEIVGVSKVEIGNYVQSEGLIDLDDEEDTPEELLGYSSVFQISTVVKIE